MMNMGEYVNENIKTLAATAWRGHQSEGRGAVVAQIHFADNDVNAAMVGQSLEYLSENDISVKGSSGWPAALADVVRRYDPETEIVVLLIGPNEAMGISRVGPLPLKQFYEDEMKK